MVRSPPTSLCASWFPSPPSPPGLAFSAVFTLSGGAFRGWLVGGHSFWDSVWPKTPAPRAHPQDRSAGCAVLGGQLCSRGRGDSCPDQSALWVTDRLVSDSFSAVLSSLRCLQRRYEVSQTSVLGRLHREQFAFQPDTPFIFTCFACSSLGPFLGPLSRLPGCFPCVRPGVLSGELRLSGTHLSVPGFLTDPFSPPPAFASSKPVLLS